MPGKKKLSPEQQRQFDDYVSQLSFRNSVAKKYLEKGINVNESPYNKVNLKQDTIVKVRGGSYKKENPLYAAGPSILARNEIRKKMDEFNQYRFDNIQPHTTQEKNKKTGRIDVFGVGIFNKQKK